MRREAIVAGMMLLVFIYAAFAQDVLPPDHSKADLQYIKDKKERGTLSLNDPIYLKLLEKTHADAAIPSSGSTDQGADSCPATHIYNVPYTDSGRTCGQHNDFFACGYYSFDVIYEFYCTEWGPYEINVLSSEYMTALEVRSGGDCPGLYEEGCNCGFYGSNGSALFLTLNPGTMYYFIVGGYTPQCGDYVINVFPDHPALGRCCYGSLSNPFCQVTTQSDCIHYLSGSWTQGENCISPCLPLGRCCYGDPSNPSCLVTTEGECFDYYHSANWTRGENCNLPCPITWPCNWVNDGIVQNPDGSYTYRQTTRATSTPPLYYGPFSHPNSSCDTQSGFDIYSWFDGDYGWAHYWSGWNQGYTIQSAQVSICAYDVDLYTCLQGGDPTACETNSLLADGVPTIPSYLFGDNEIWSQTTVDIAPGALLDDGYVNMFVNIDVWHDTCFSATTLSWSQLTVTYITSGVNNPPYTPWAEGMTCISPDSIIHMTITGPYPADPDYDEVTYQYRWFVANDLTGWGYIDDELNPNHPINHTGNFIPATDFDVNDSWCVQVYAVDEWGVQSLYPLIVNFPQVAPNCNNCENIDCENIIVINSIPWSSSYDLCQFCNHYDLSPCTGGISNAPDMVFEMVVPENNSDLSVIATPLGNWDIALVLSYSCSESYWSCICGQVYRGSGPENREGAGEPEQCNLINLPPDDVIFIFVSGNGTDCGPFSLFIGSPQPPQIQSLTIERSGTDALLSWGLPSSGYPDWFIIYRSTDPNFIPTHADSVGATPDTWWIDPEALEVSDHYFYRVSSYNYVED